MSKTADSVDVTLGFEPGENPYRQSYPDGLDPDDLPPGLETLYVSPKRATKRYHLHVGCDRLRENYDDRRANIAAAWYSPCRYCVTGEFPRSSEDYERLRDEGVEFDWGKTHDGAALVDPDQEGDDGD